MLILLIMSCHSTNYYEVNGIKNEVLTRKQGNIYSNTVDYRTNNRANDNNKEEKEMSIKEDVTWEEEVRNVENLNELITVIGSAIAGVYCAVKAIINAIKGLKNKNS